MGHEQHIRNNSTICLPNDELTIKNDERQNNSGEHEDEQVILKYDPSWYDTTDSYDNESDFGDDNNEYMEPTCNDSNPDVRVGYVSIDEPIEGRHFHKFNEPLEVSPQKTNVKREWEDPGSEDYSIQIIPIMMSSTDDHELYKCAMFMSKKELKMTLGTLVLKKKFEYQIRRSSKTHFKAS